MDWLKTLKRRELLLTTCLFHFFISPLSGQLLAEDSSTKYTISYLAPGPSLAARIIRSAILDHRQVLWMTTEDGIYILQDGKSHRFSIKEAFDIVEDSEGRLWFSGAQGLLVLSKDRSNWLSPAQLGLPKLTKQRILLASMAESEIAIFDAPNLYRYHTKTQRWFIQVRLTMSTSECNQLKYDAPKKALYLSHHFTMWCKIQGKRVVMLNKPNRADSPAILGNLHYEVDTRSSLLNISSDSLTYWVLFDDFYAPKLSQIERDSFVLIKNKLRDNHKIWQALYQYIIDRPKHLPKLEWKRLLPTQICVNKQGTWFLATKQGLFIIQKKAALPFGRLIPGHSVRGITQDPEGRLLVSTYGNLFRFNGPQFQEPPKKWPTIIPVWDFLWYPQHLYLAAEAEPSLVKIAYQDSILARLFPLNDKNIMKWTQNKLPLRLQGLPPGLKLIRAKQGFWSFYAQSLIKFDREGNARFYHPLDYRQIRFMCMLMSKDSSIWLGGATGLIHVYPKEGGRKIRQAPEDIPASLKDCNIKCIYEDHSGYLWIGTLEQGLARLDRSTKEVKWYTQSQGLAENTVYSIQGSHGDSLLWLGTQHGLSCLHVHFDQVVNYYQKNGLADNEFNTGSVHKAKDGTLFFGGLNGVTYFKPWMPDFFKKTLTPYISVKMLNRSTQVSRNVYLSPNEKVIIQPQEKYFEIDLHANHWDKDLLQYRYKLAGADHEWQQLSGVKKLIFFNLQPGCYQLWIRARTQQEGWSKALSFIIHIRPAWYQTWWFIVTVCMIVAMGIYQIYLFRLQQVRNEYLLRKQISDDLHDDLSSRLYALRTMAGEIVHSNSERRETLSNRFEQLSVDVLQSVRDFIWAFDPKHDSLDQFTRRLEDFAENAIGPNVKELEFESTLSAKEKQLGAITRHHILMVYQELLTNMLKHTQSEKIYIKIYSCNQYLNILIINDFKLLKDKQNINNSEGYGQESIQRRLRSIQGKVTWAATAQRQTAEIQIVKK
jgi:ligand-binding sensor domain-containing protein